MKPLLGLVAGSTGCRVDRLTHGVWLGRGFHPNRIVRLLGAIEDMIALCIALIGIAKLLHRSRPSLGSSLSLCLSPGLSLSLAFVLILVLILILILG